VLKYFQFSEKFLPDAPEPCCTAKTAPDRAVPEKTAGKKHRGKTAMLSYQI
jgi:hypothetical protein